MLAEVVAAVSEQALRLCGGPASKAPYAWDRVQERVELGDIVPVPAGERDRERATVTVDDHIVHRSR